MRITGKDEPVPVVKADIPYVLPLTVEVVDNHIYFYAEVDSDRCLAMMKQIREVDTRLRNEMLSRDLPLGTPSTPIWLHVRSWGGSLLDAFGVADELATIPSPVYSIVDGYTASAAAIISMACTRRFIRPSSFMLIHDFTSVFWGTHEQFKDEAIFLDMVKERLVRFYIERSKLKEKKVRSALKRDFWMNAEQALKYGLVDEVKT